MSRVYSPYLERYVRKLAPIKGSIYEVAPKKLISPIAANGSLVTHTFPTTARLAENATWSCDVHNTGTSGVIAFGLVNDAGNPGNIVINFKGLDTTLEPGTYCRIASVDSVPNCTHIIESGLVRFLTKGTYTILLWGMHQEGAAWYYDTEVPKNVVVDGGEGKTKSIAVLSSYGLSLPIGWASVFKNQPLDLEYNPTKTTITKVTLNVTAVSTIDVRGLTILMNNNEIGGLGWPAFDANKPKSISIDVTGRIAENSEGVSHNTFEFNYWIALGISIFGGTCTITATLIVEYTGDAPTARTPPSPFKLEWWQWGLIGGAGILGAWAWLSRKGYAPSPTIIITQPYEYVKEKLEERKR